MDDDRGQLLRQEYISRINLVQDYIEENISKMFTLEELSKISGFSKYHFHRIFRSIVNETLYNFIIRLKLERAVGFLMNSSDKTITDIALNFGFNDSAVFARCFKKHYGMSATKYKAKYSNNRQDVSLPPVYNDINNTNNWRKNKMKVECKVEIIDMPEMTVAYLRHFGTFKLLAEKFQEMISKLVSWGFANGVMKQGETKILAVYHDNPNITQDDKLRTSICLSIPENTKVEGEFSKMTIAAGKYAVGHFEFDDKDAALQHANAWDYFYGVWLPESGYQPEDGNNFEVYVNDPNTHPERKHLLDIYMPIKPLY